MAGEERHPQHLPAGERTSLLGRASARHGYDNESAPPHADRDVSPSSTVGSHQERDSAQLRKNVVLLLGVFLVNSDSAILLAMFRQIASNFGSLNSASWIITAYLLGLISVQPLYGKLSDIYGRKPLLLAAYIFYCVGGLLAGSGLSFSALLIGRGICGIGNAGITVLISTLIVDLVPLRDVAVWRSYAYAVNQVGRAVGPSIGGLIADRTHWRWALLIQVPFNLFAALYIWKRMTFPAPPTNKTHTEPTQEATRRSKLRRIDFSGSITLGLANISLLLLLDQIQASPDTFGQDSSTLFPLSSWLVFMTLFFFVEGFWAREPIFPLRLLAKRNVVSSYAIQFLQTGAQMALYTSVPLYFRVTGGDTSSRAAIRLLVITLGTVAGSLVSGFAIKRTGLYRLVTLLSTALSSLSFLAVFLRWRGPTSWAETLYGFPIGMAFGVSLSAAFIGLTAALEPYQVAVGTSGFYMCLNLGSLVGVSAASTLICTFVERALREGLAGLPDVEKVIREVTSRFERINELPEEVARVVLEAYTRSFGNVWLFALLFSCVALFASFVMHEGLAERKPASARRSRPKSAGRGYAACAEEEAEEA
ncbi:putative multidrug resistance protein fnx1 [Staphylotrichum tortipilum]|uniref:Multidrug resistance protein fnx1 n=1 Tax=Staphylotrichum tortipilum TaxID=2831512 RepID=A0AAN6MIV4_9PEZI|nr:putative multidrug resistance protein fnx1 [Staphylotrichum longicolle]